MHYRFGCTYGYAEGDYRTDVLYLGCGYRFAFGYGLQYFRAAVEICQSRVPSIKLIRGYDEILKFKTKSVQAYS